MRDSHLRSKTGAGFASFHLCVYINSVITAEKGQVSVLFLQETADDLFSLEKPWVLTSCVGSWDAAVAGLCRPGTSRRPHVVLRREETRSVMRPGVLPWPWSLSAGRVSISRAKNQMIPGVM